MEFILPFLEAGAEVLAEYGAEEIGSAIGGETAEFLATPVGRELGGSLLKFGGEKTFGSFRPQHGEEGFFDRGIGRAVQEALAEDDYQKEIMKPLPLQDIVIPTKKAPLASIIKPPAGLPGELAQIVEPQPTGFRLHYKEKRPKINVIYAPADQLYEPIQRNTSTPYRTSNAMYGNTGGF